jgi:hypothetical protein
MDLDKIAAKVVEAGGGMSESALYGRIRRALLSGIRDIERNFINVSLKYGDREVNGTVDGHTVKFFYNIQRASNGEVAGLPVLVVDGKANKNFYGKISGELAKMLKETGGKAASVKTAKINQKGYRYWVVVDGKIESGWEYTEDAKEQLEGNLPAGKKGKVLGKVGLSRLGLDPDDDNAWHKGRIASVTIARELVKIAKELVGAAGPLTLLEELKSNIHKLDDDKFLKMTSHGWGYTPGVDYIYGMAGNDIAHAIVGYSVGNYDKEQIQRTVKENIDRAIEDNQPFKGLRGEQQETRNLWFELMKGKKKKVGAMPYGRDAGNVKRVVGQLLKRAGWDTVHISEDRSGAGFNVYATRKVEQLPDVRTDAGRTNEDLLGELQREVKPLEKQLEQKLNPKPEEVTVKVNLIDGKQTARLYVWLKYDVGGTVTPIEFL